MERLVALRPDVVVVWEGGGNVAQIEKLERIRVPVYRHKAETLARCRLRCAGSAS